MKKYASAFLLVIVLVSGCNKPGGDPGVKTIETTPRMKDFIDMLDGDYKSVTIAMKKYADKYVVDDDITRLDLSNARIVSSYLDASDNECFTFKAQVGVLERTITLCWKDNKIISVEDKGYEEL